eukprot:1361031-Pyramimonas_sp.AAC.1
MGRKSRYGRMGCSVCLEEIIYQAIPWQPNTLQPAMNWRNAGVLKDPRPDNPLHERGSRQRARAAQIQNSDRAEA